MLQGQGDPVYGGTPHFDHPPFRFTAAYLRGRATMVKLARYFGLSRGAIYRIAKAWIAGGEEAVERLRWGRGGSHKNLFL